MVRENKKTVLRAIDGFKFVVGSMRLLSVDMVKSIHKICHDHEVYVSTVGFVEYIIVQSTDAVDRYLKECKSSGFDSGSLKLTRPDTIRRQGSDSQVKKMGMIPKPEISLMIGAGASTHIVGYKPQLKSVDDLMEEARAHLKAGAHIMMLESEGITEDLPPSKWRTDVIKKLVTELGFESWIFESSDPPVFK